MANEHPLILEADDFQGRKVTEVRLAVKLSPVEQMYRHKNLMAADHASGGAPDYATGNDTRHPEPENLPDASCNDKSFVFVHGFNVSPDAARGWNAEMFKRMYQAGSRARFYGVTWHGDETEGTIVPHYHKNVDNAFSTAEALADFIKGLGANVTVAAHSLGNIVIGSAIQDWKAIPENYFMIDAAVALESYDGDTGIDDAMTHPDWNDYQVRVWASEWYANPTFRADDGRQKLTWRNRLGKVSANTYNFFSTSEDVLRRHPGDPEAPDVIETALSGGRHAWALQEKLKGRQVNLGFGKCGSTYGGWLFSHNIYPPGAASPEQAAQVSDAILRADPVFDPGFTLRISPPSPDGAPPPKEVHSGAPNWIADLTDPAKGSVTAQAHGNQLLAEMFPSRTLPAGANNLSKFEDRNFDMPALYTNGWPRERGAITDWMHSDVRVVAYPYIYKLFEKWKTLGGLGE